MVTLQEQRPVFGSGKGERLPGEEHRGPDCHHHDNDDDDDDDGDGDGDGDHHLQDIKNQKLEIQINIQKFRAIQVNTSPSLSPKAHLAADKRHIQM